MNEYDSGREDIRHETALIPKERHIIYVTKGQWLVLCQGLVQIKMMVFMP